MQTWETMTLEMRKDFPRCLPPPIPFLGSGPNSSWEIVTPAIQQHGSLEPLHDSVAAAAAAAHSEDDGDCNDYDDGDDD